MKLYKEIKMRDNRLNWLITLVWGKVLPACFFFQAGNADNWLSTILFIGFGVFTLGVQLR